MSSNPETDATTGLLDSTSAMRSYLDLIETNMNLSTVRSLALKTIAHPQIFCGFDEFKTCCSQLLLPQQGQTQTTTASNSLFNTLDLFSFGTLNDYQKQSESTGQPEAEHYLPLNELALAKLRQLTVLTCIQKACFDGKTRISYDVVAEALGLTIDTMQDEGASFDATTTTANTTTAIRDVEDAIVQCLYTNVLKGKLCQKTRTFGWQGECLPVVSSRDIPPTLIPSLLSELQGLGRRLEKSGIEVTQAQEQVTQGLQDTAQYWKNVRNQKKTSTKDEAFPKGGSNGGGGDGVVARSIFGGKSGGTQGNLWHESSGAGGSGRSRSTKRSRGGMSGNFLMDAGKRI
jgi:hypothetical protein